MEINRKTKNRFYKSEEKNKEKTNTKSQKKGKAKIPQNMLKKREKYVKNSKIKLKNIKKQMFHVKQ